ncbi:hypothetical protein D3C77_646700 [compost metagenome]
MDEGQQVGVDLVWMGGAQAVGKARVDLERACANELGAEQGRVGDRHDLVVVAMHDQHGYVDRLEVFGKIGL